jgi:hypothetical protein
MTNLFVPVEKGNVERKSPGWIGRKKICKQNIEIASVPILIN